MVVVEPVEGQGLWSEALLVFGAEALVLDLRRPVTPAERQALVHLGLAGAFAVVTPCNPRGRILSPPENTARSRAFAERELPGVPGAIAAEGRSVDGAHREPGWALPLPIAEAAALAVRWEQLGLYWWDGHRFGIVRTGLR